MDCFSEAGRYQELIWSCRTIASYMRFVLFNKYPQNLNSHWTYANPLTSHLDLCYFTYDVTSSMICLRMVVCEKMLSATHACVLSHWVVSNFLQPLRLQPVDFVPLNPQRSPSPIYSNCYFYCNCWVGCNNDKTQLFLFFTVTYLRNFYLEPFDK